MASDPIILVTAATGTQSSSLIRALSTWSSAQSLRLTIHATTRDPSSVAAQSLLTHSHPLCTITLFTTDFEQPSTLTAPATSASHAFVNLTPVLTDPTAELRQGTNILNALRTNASTTLRRVVYTTATSVRDPNDPNSYTPGSLTPTSWMHTYYQSKHNLEKLTATLATSLSIPFTILHPGNFLTNLLPPSSLFMYPSLSNPSHPTITTALNPTFRAPWLDPNDIGAFAARALLLPSTDPLYVSRYQGQTVELAQRLATLAEVVEVMNAQLARDPEARGKVGRVEMTYMGEEEAEERVKGGDVLTGSQVFMNRNQGRFEVDLEGVKGLGVEMVGAREFFERESGRVRRAVGL